MILIGACTHWFDTPEACRERELNWRLLDERMRREQRRQHDETTQRGEASAKPEEGCELFDLLAAMHEASHVVYSYVNKNPILDVKIDGKGRGGGEFRHSKKSVVELSDASDEKVRAKEDLMIMGALLEEENAQAWLRDLVGFAVSKPAQHKFGAVQPFYDAACEHDDRVIDRVIGFLARSPEQARQLRARVEREAKEFVDTHWSAIERLGNRLFEAGHLDKEEIEAVLGHDAQQSRVISYNPPLYLRRTDGYMG